MLWRASFEGYFLLSSDPSKLLVALSVVRDGHIWAPRDAVALMVSQGSEDNATGGSLMSATELISANEISTMKERPRAV